jgi:hypothetical protein
LGWAKLNRRSGPSEVAKSSLLVRDYRGKQILVKVLENGFQYDDRQYTSLTAIAQEVTGTKWNGFAFFGLTTKEAASAQR